MVYQTKNLFLSSCLALIGAWYMPCAAVDAPGSFEWQVAQVEDGIEQDLNQSVVECFLAAVKGRDYETAVSLYIETYWHLGQGHEQTEGISDDAVTTAVEAMRKKYAYDVILAGDYSVDEFEELRRYTHNKVLCRPNCEHDKDELCRKNREPGKDSLLATIDEGLRNAPTSLWSRYLQKCRQTYQSACSWIPDVDVCASLYTAGGYVGGALTWAKVALISLWNRCRS